MKDSPIDYIPATKKAYPAVNRHNRHVTEGDGELEHKRKLVETHPRPPVVTAPTRPRTPQLVPVLASVSCRNICARLRHIHAGSKFSQKLRGRWEDAVAYAAGGYKQTSYDAHAREVRGARHETSRNHRLQVEQRREKHKVRVNTHRSA